MVLKLIGLNPSVSHQEFLKAIDAVSNAQNITELFTHAQAMTVFRFGSYHHIPAIGCYDFDRLDRYWSFGLDADFKNYLTEKGHRSDPIMKYVLAEAGPCWLSCLLDKAELSDGRSQHRIKLALDYGDAMLIPLFGPYYRRGYISLGPHESREFYGEIFLWQIHAILQAGHIRYCKLMESLRSSVKLNERESEVLELISFGKTNPEIGIILGISTSTVAGHVKRIFLKLNTNDRVTAALRAQNFSL